MAHAKNHDYHIIAPSIWPLLGGISGFTMLVGAVLWMHGIDWYIWAIGFIAVLYTMFNWWSEMAAEGESADNTPVVRLGLQYGFILFIMSEVMFFFAWFWSFFKHAIYPMYDYPGSVYEQVHYHFANPLNIPLMNTLLLLLSGCAVTWAHHALVHNNDRKSLIQGLALGITLGILFTALQAYEYMVLLTHDGWTFGEDQFYSNFFMATGFHGLHVLIGTVFLTICLIRAINGGFSQDKHGGFEAAAWYWHFVDVVWLFLFFAVYLWGSYALS
ncbi:cytochrome c oxidase subunit 3 [Chachezhania antarctica]|uniref:cytochrome c oxidase subunit 3 n=1 Tax=Chachezhania antarctica TaxID=2340860 RepID=UPI000EACC41D|nr:cytochrome c oxidase subunit 3 [Chachezhania antarctica]|tara:strand:- start:1399 stop:2214 length:816 start_codon:yes stop_codon:yes gene_type:complete